ncbi:hypothetical protein EUX98_g4091 [Antrodiella citrinella]|uniref:Glucose-methanol-choline oxidoreductase C-terminal domain-containing protein n=1 Tax=Antrodiella citrinella TaxID=2447956 RepID=A0A4S4MUX2_9APHY|nr:hypothetical protein EUX98_g4091 [Antrodiella citrinella]
MMALLLALPLDASVVDGGTYDYVVVGGGTAGLTVTSRLSEDPSKRVLFTVALGGPMDWSWLADQNKTIHGRGNVTILSADSFEKPRVIVNYFNVDFDLALHIEGCRLARKIFQSAAMSSLSAGETVPGFQKVPDNSEGGSEEDWAQWVLHDPQFSFGSVAHPIGTAAMMRRSLGGVVDARLKVYDTTNVRVVDASILPWQISAHLSSTIYGIVEKAADFIKSGV